MSNTNPTKTQMQYSYATNFRLLHWMLDFGFETQIPCRMVGHHCPLPIKMCHHGRYFNFVDLLYYALQRWYTQIEEFLCKRKLSTMYWLLDEPKFRNTNYSIDPLATTFFNDPISQLFWRKKSHRYWLR